VVNTSASCSGDPGFKSGPQSRLSVLRGLSCFFSASPYKFLDSPYIKIVDGSFLPHRFKHCSTLCKMRSSKSIIKLSKEESYSYLFHSLGQRSVLTSEFPSFSWSLKIFLPLVVYINWKTYFGICVPRIFPTCLTPQFMLSFTLSEMENFVIRL
jgi:hypothetical protein